MPSWRSAYLLAFMVLHLEERGLIGLQTHGMQALMPICPLRSPRGTLGAEGWGDRFDPRDLHCQKRDAIDRRQMREETALEPPRVRRPAYTYWVAPHRCNRPRLAAAIGACYPINVETERRYEQRLGEGLRLAFDGKDDDRSRRIDMHPRMNPPIVARRHTRQALEQPPEVADVVKAALHGDRVYRRRAFAQ